MKLVLLDNGHGLETKGKRSPVWTDTPQIIEAIYARRLVKAIAPKIKVDCQVLVPEESDVSLSQRCKRVNNLCNLFGKDNVLLVSVHLNAHSGVKEAHMGWEAYTYFGNSASDTLATKFYSIAENLLPPEIPIRKDLSDGDLDKEANFAMLRDTQCTAVLTENLFMTSHNDCRYLNSIVGFDTIVDLHVSAINEFCM